MFLGRKKRVPAVVPPATGRPARDPFEAVPLAAPGVAEERGDDGSLVLVHRVPVPPRYARLLGRYLGRERVSRTVLDENGAFFWRQIDGVRSLGSIADAVRVRLNQPEAQARESAVAFTKDLMKRNLIQLKLKA